MILLEKSKVALTLICESDTYAPGSTVTGTLQLEVHHTVFFTALQIRFRGQEKFYVQRDGANHHTYYDRREFTHIEEVHTFLGAPEGNASPGATQLEPGVYSYPFSFYVPPHAPPSFERCRGDYGCKLAYTLKGYLDIPRGFDAEVKRSITVTQAVPVSQLQPARENLKLLPVSEANVAKCLFCGCCFCCVDEESFIRTEAAIAPAIVLMKSHVSLPVVMAVAQDCAKREEGDAGDAWVRSVPVPTDSSLALLRLRVTNFAKEKAPSRCMVRLAQRHDFPRDAGRFYMDTFTFCKQEVLFPEGPLHFGQTSTVDVLLRFDEARANLPSGERLLPCLAVKHFSIFTELQITFPEVTAEGTMRQQNALLLADEVDMTNQRVEMPYIYNVRLRAAADEPPVWQGGRNSF
ncbi:hypothetical protein ABL78_7756 [Leptomonas seymouri]|uniref:Arrestin-like N-terminal domain-containing protein n=1 Tax=Leptomonas seymouri TaxID=5684 RepID=A0A0N0P340_LEPSE|nr:hypothetical protein ABL78_7756 [Leptomonas seymouri]|eukprot:KPI83217.1 hypothetical protein ABL78_7756 [Leptomonas seymouri]